MDGTNASGKVTNYGRYGLYGQIGMSDVHFVHIVHIVHIVHTLKGRRFARADPNRPASRDLSKGVSQNNPDPLVDTRYR